MGDFHLGSAPLQVGARLACDACGGALRAGDPQRAAAWHHQWRAGRSGAGRGPRASLWPLIVAVARSRRARGACSRGWCLQPIAAQPPTALPRPPARAGSSRQQTGLIRPPGARGRPLQWLRACRLHATSFAWPVRGRSALAGEQCSHLRAAHARPHAPGPTGAAPPLPPVGRAGQGTV
jgi:hypothetical protein